MSLNRYQRHLSTFSNVSSNQVHNYFICGSNTLTIYIYVFECADPEYLYTFQVDVAY